MSIKISIKRRDLIIAVLVASGLLTVGFVALLNRDSFEQSQAKYYSQQLDKLKTDVQSINSHTARKDTATSVPNQINQYQATILDMLAACQGMDGRYEKIKNNPKAKSILQPMGMAQTLCKDLRGVNDYALDHSKTTKDFIVFPADMSNSPADSSLQKLQAILESTKTDLEKLKSNPINDPALVEQITLLQELQKQAGEAAGNSEKLSELAGKTKTRQSDFLNARGYFWKNTIGIDPLEKSITRLQAQFSR